MNIVLYIHFELIRISGIEPESRPWKGGVLPLYYMRLEAMNAFLFFSFLLFSYDL